MSRLSRKHKKRFTCGHQGYGRYCHCCAARLAHPQAKLTIKQTQRQQWQLTLTQDVIPLSHLPKKIVKKARAILSALQQGTNYWQLSGKRLSIMRHVIKIPVTYRYRLLCRDDGDRVTPIKVISHEDYNPLVKNPKRLLRSLVSKSTHPS